MTYTYTTTEAEAGERTEADAVAYHAARPMDCGAITDPNGVNGKQTALPPGWTLETTHDDDTPPRLKGQIEVKTAEGFVAEMGRLVTVDTPVVYFQHGALSLVGHPDPAHVVDGGFDDVTVRLTPVVSPEFGEWDDAQPMKLGEWEEFIQDHADDINEGADHAGSATFTTVLADARNWKSEVRKVVTRNKGKETDEATVMETYEALANEHAIPGFTVLIPVVDFGLKVPVQVRIVRNHDRQTIQPVITASKRLRRDALRAECRRALSQGEYDGIA